MTSHLPLSPHILFLVCSLKDTICILIVPIASVTYFLPAIQRKISLCFEETLQKIFKSPSKHECVVREILVLIMSFFRYAQSKSFHFDFAQTKSICPNIETTRTKGTIRTKGVLPQHISWNLNTMPSAVTWTDTLYMFTWVSTWIKKAHNLWKQELSVTRLQIPDKPANTTPESADPIHRCTH